MTIERAAVSVGVDLTLRLPDRPGSMADLCERLASNGIEIEGICGLIERGVDVDHLLVRDANAARPVIEAAGAAVQAEREVLVVDDAHDLEVIARLTRRVAVAAVGIDLIYLAIDERLVLGVDDLEAVRSALVS
jgi:hypothetical protein